jgi:aldose 1-epimerase
MNRKDFGRTTAGVETFLYSISNQGIRATFTDYGATLVNLYIEKDNEEEVDVVLGYDDAQGYENGTYFFGCPLGRNANRIGGATFQLEGTTYELDKNDNGNNLHSGLDYYSKRIWNVLEVTEDSITFSLESSDGDQGFPGNVVITMTYELTSDKMLRITYSGTPDKDTIMNLTNHSYFNLNGHNQGDILGHLVTIDGDYYTKTDENSIPTGILVEVEETPMDLREGKKVGAEIEVDYEALNIGLGYDHNWALNNDGNFQKVATATGDKSGIQMEVYTDLPGIQLYTGNFIVDENGKDGAVYPKRGGFCYETQFFPDAIHHENFVSPITKAKEEYLTVTGYKFKV